MNREVGVGMTHKASTKDLESTAETNLIFKEHKELVGPLQHKHFPLLRSHQYDSHKCRRKLTLSAFLKVWENKKIIVTFFQKCSLPGVPRATFLMVFSPDGLVCYIFSDEFFKWKQYIFFETQINDKFVRNWNRKKKNKNKKINFLLILFDIKNNDRY